ncbi:MAG TPA: 2-phospho-L-lactate guanylyltransferase [Acetobacteraceae bacterium]|nr:2-phospho-L-lactate guanylyltransferase [Acetobacteraceae bacterium]
MSRGVWAAVPVKAFAGAKHRLSPLLTPAQRQALAAAMLRDVLIALAEAPLAGIMVNTVDPQASALARAYGARVVSEDARAGHTAAVAAMARTLAGEGAEAMLTCPGDVPLLTAAEVASVLDAHGPAPSFTIVPAHDERGSNAVLLSPPDLMALRFGDDSFLPHLAAARQHGLEPSIVRLTGIGLDIDNPEDARAFLRAARGRSTEAGTLLRSFLI